MKRPSFQFYPADWLRDTALRSCSIGARGLWIDMICFMHEGNPYGHLKVGNKVILAFNLSGMVGATLDDVEGWLDELKQAGVYDVDHDGTIVSRRMIKDENLRNMRAAGGKLGGNPALKDNHKVNHKVKQNSTPSSSSSSSSSNKERESPTGSRLPADWVMPDEYKTFCQTERPDLIPSEVEDRFRDYWHGVAGAKGRKADWFATWRNWCRGEKRALQPVQQVTTPSRQGPDPALAKIIADGLKASKPPDEVREKMRQITGR